MVDIPKGGAGGLAAEAAEGKADASATQVPQELAPVGKAIENVNPSNPAGSPDTASGELGPGQGGAPGPAGLPAAPGAPPALAAALTGDKVGDEGAKAPDADAEKDSPLGAGGTSDAIPMPGEDDGVIEKKGSGKKAAMGAAAVPAGAVATQMMMLMMFLNWLKGIAMAAAALVMNLVNAIVGAAIAGVKAVVGFFMGVGTAVSSAVGGVVSAAAAGVTSFTAAVAIGAVALVGGITASNATELAQRDGLMSCQPAAKAALAGVEGSEGNTEEIAKRHVQTIYSVFAAWGMPDENIAGIVGNWDAESSLDPTSVEGNFSAPQQMTEEKKAEAQTITNGIGVAQWTGTRNQGLRDYADVHEKDWWTLDIQLGFLISPNEGSDAEIVKGMITESKGTPSDAALYFHDTWERSNDTPAMAQRRGENATKWMGLFSGWVADIDLADSILAQSGATIGEANNARAASVRGECLGVGQGKLSLKAGGLTLEEAEKLMELYIQEGDQFLVDRYGAGGPGDCGFGKADNCVGFSTYFANKYTSFQQYAVGNGIDTAGAMARAMNKELTKVPTVYSVASGPGTGSAGHTFVVLGIKGDMAVIGEAACGTNHRGTKARLMPLSSLTNGSWSFVDVSDLILADPENPDGPSK